MAYAQWPDRRTYDAAQSIPVIDAEARMMFRESIEESYPDIYIETSKPDWAMQMKQLLLDIKAAVGKAREVRKKRIAGCRKKAQQSFVEGEVTPDDEEASSRSDGSNPQCVCRADHDAAD